MGVRHFQLHTRHFIRAIQRCNHGCAERILRKWPAIISDRDSLQESPLHWLAIENELEGVKLLIAAGADVNAQDEFGNSVLMHVAGSALLDLTRCLIEHGADVHYQTPDFGDGPLHCAARHSEDVRVVDLIISCRADVNRRNLLGQAPLHEAVGLGNYEAVKLLIARGADVNVCDGAEQRPLDLLPADAPDDVRNLLAGDEKM